MEKIGKVEPMERVYIICMGIGIGVPLLSILFGQITDIVDGIFDGAFTDFSISIGDSSICILPFSMQSICAGLLIFGSVGKILSDKMRPHFVVLIAFILAYLIAIIVQTLIKKLKSVENTAYKKEELLLFDAKVVHTIMKGGFGSISITTLDGITTNYPAKAKDANVEIRQETKVQVLYFDRNIAVVEEKNE